MLSAAVVVETTTVVLLFQIVITAVELLRERARKKELF